MYSTCNFMFFERKNIQAYMYFRAKWRLLCLHVLSLKYFSQHAGSFQNWEHHFDISLF